MSFLSFEKQNAADENPRRFYWEGAGDGLCRVWLCVIPAKAGTHDRQRSCGLPWMAAVAAMTWLSNLERLQRLGRKQLFWLQEPLRESALEMIAQERLKLGVIGLKPV